MTDYTAKTARSRQSEKSKITELSKPQIRELVRQCFPEAHVKKQNDYFVIYLGEGRVPTMVGRCPDHCYRLVYEWMEEYFLPEDEVFGHE